jgi:excisionase family DNA binding protein
MELLTITDAAKRLDLCTRSLNLLVASGKLKAVRIGPAGGKIRFTPEALEEYLVSCQRYGSRDQQRPASSRRRAPHSA